MKTKGIVKVVLPFDFSNIQRFTAKAISSSNSLNSVVEDFIVVLVTEPSSVMVRVRKRLPAKPGFFLRYLLYIWRRPGLRCLRVFMIESTARFPPETISMSDF